MWLCDTGNVAVQIANDACWQTVLHASSTWLQQLGNGAA